LLDEKLELLNEWLLSRTFLVGHQLSLADLVIYGTISPAVVTFPVAQHGHFQNLLRWYDHIHSLADPTSIFPPARFQKPKLIRPLPVAPKPTKSEQPTASSSALTSAEAKEKSEERAKKSVTGKSKGGDTKGTSKQPPVTPQASAEVFHNKASASTESSNDGPTVDSVDIRVGLIKSVGPHPNADSLYVEEIDVGEEAPRQVVSGLRKFVPLEKMEGRKVVVVCNLKPAKMREVMSYGMVLCSSNADHTAVDPIIPPADAIPGERVRFEGFSSDPEPQLNPRKKIFEKIAVDLKTNAGKW
jgi:aminoacyl tRNA synthase complex-interacting multifunctional protein 1